MGARVSIFGDYAEYKAEDFASSEYYNLHPHVLQPILRLYSELYARKTYPQFDCEPWEAVSATNWAAMELGLDKRRSPAEIRQLFGWDSVSIAKRRFKQLSRSLSRGPEKMVKRLLSR